MDQSTQPVDQPTEDDLVVEIPDDLSVETQMQVDEAVNRLTNMPEIRQEAWERQNVSERLGTLQSIENIMSEIQGRPSMVVATEILKPTEFGGYDGNRIIINESHLSGNVMQANEFIDTIIHEGRHAYQDAVVKNPAIAGNSDTVQAWEDNMKNYLSLEQYGQEIYQSQPIEADAWSYAAQITRRIYSSSEKDSR